MTEEKKQSLQATSRILCEAYNLLLSKGEVLFPIEDSHADKLDIIVKTIEGSYFNVNRFDTPEKRAAGYFCLLIKDHPMTDGNKRLAVLWLEVFCDILGLTISLPPDLTLDTLAVTVVNTSDMDMDQLYETVRVILFGK